MLYKGKRIRMDAVTCEMVSEYIMEHRYKLLLASTTLESLQSNRFYKKKTLEDAIDFHYNIEIRRKEKRDRKEEKRRLNQEAYEKRRKAFLEEAYHIYTDGSCDNVHTKVGGSGYIILKDGEIIKKQNKGFFPTTNNRMEMLAIISALNSIPKKSKAIIFTDSKYCIKVLDGYMHEKNQDLIRLYIDIRKGLGRVEFHWVKGHNGNEYNEMADNLAFSAFMEMSRKLGKPVSKWMNRTH